MMNPHLLEATYLRVKNPSRAMKYYRPAFGAKGRYVGCRHAFKTALLAKQHAQAVHARWCRLYDAMITALLGEAA